MPARRQGTPNRDLILLCALALLCRLALAWALPGIAHPDEVFQYMEQAHRLVSGIGLVPWEWQVGARSWFIPGLLWPVMALAQLLHLPPWVTHGLVASLMAVLWLPVVASAYVWGRRIAGRPGALCAGIANAVWFETLNLSVHPLADTFGALFLVPALCLCGAAPCRRVLAGAGALFGLGLVARIQLAPMVVLAAIWTCRADWRSWVTMAMGGALPVLLSGLLDWYSLGHPFQSTLQYWHYNVSLHAADVFGVKPWFTYVFLQMVFSAGLVLPLALPAMRAAMRAPMPLAAAILYIVMLSLIGHKEERFVLPVLPLLLTLSAAGTALLLRGRHIAAQCVAWAGVSALLGSTGFYSTVWRPGVAVLSLTAQVNTDRQSCGLGISPTDEWGLTGGYTALRPGITMYAGENARPEAFNRLITIWRQDAMPAPFVPGGFAPVRCIDDRDNAGRPLRICLLRRMGGCDPAASPPLAAVVPEMAKLLP